MDLFGRVLWWSDRDENGIIVDPLGNEFYFDISVLKASSKNKITRDKLVYFELNNQINDCLCAHKVSLAPASKQKYLEKKYHQLARLGADMGATSEQ
jgi:hypothetical protein